MTPLRLALATALCAATLCAPDIAAAGAPHCRLPHYGPGSHYHPHFAVGADPARVTNPWFPLRVGTTYLYSGTDDHRPAVDVVTVSRHTRAVNGVRTREVKDRLLIRGHLEETTTDYYAQDRCGNVWYLGEDTAQLDGHGNVVNTDGTWHAGADGAKPGVFMQAHPEVGRRFRQEWYRGQAEDTYVARDLATRSTIPYGTYPHAMRTAEHTALEPDVHDAKYYVRGIGEVEEVTVSGGHEKFVLVDVIR